MTLVNSIKREWNVDLDLISSVTRSKNTSSILSLWASDQHIATWHPSCWSLLTAIISGAPFEICSRWLHCTVTSVYTSPHSFVKTLTNRIEVGICLFHEATLCRKTCKNLSRNDHSFINEVTFTAQFIWRNFTRKAFTTQLNYCSIRFSESFLVLIIEENQHES